MIYLQVLTEQETERGFLENGPFHGFYPRSAKLQSHYSNAFYGSMVKKQKHEEEATAVSPECVCVCFLLILDIEFVGRTSRGHTGGRSHRIFHPPSFWGACLNFSREKDSAIPFPRRP